MRIISFDVHDNMINSYCTSPYLTIVQSYDNFFREGILLFLIANLSTLQNNI